MPDNVIKEFDKVGKYRVRLLHPRENPEAVVLDVREFLKLEGRGFEGFTRRGIHLRSLSDALLLSTILQDVVREWESL